MDSTTENDYFELEPFDQYKQHEVSLIYFSYFFFNKDWFICEIVEFDNLSVYLSMHLYL